MTLNTLRSLAYSDDSIVGITKKQLVVINILLSHFIDSRQEKLDLLCYWFNRPITTSKELTLSEAGAIISCGYNDDWEIQEDFGEFVRQSKSELYTF